MAFYKENVIKNKMISEMLDILDNYLVVENGNTDNRYQIYSIDYFPNGKESGFDISIIYHTYLCNDYRRVDFDCCLLLHMRHDTELNYNDKKITLWKI